MENSNHEAQNVREIQLYYKTFVKPSLRPRIKNSQDSAGILKSTWDDSKMELVEQFKVLLTNRANHVLGVLDVSTGGMSSTVADTKIIFAAALKAGASGIILSHNHPSGNLQPSKADIDLTKRVNAGAKILDIQLLDHIILTCEGYYSFADNGLI